ncbi:MAG: 50S ribosomal protein L10 [Deltaproteobacteria bacterium]|nr:50S ribosomal protein L10 [Deltaproteobacteria bacterium]
MNRSEKEAFVEELGGGLVSSQAFALLSFSKLSVEDVTAFRLGLGRNNIKVKVVKNTLAKRALEQTPFKELEPQFEGPMMLAYGPGDPVAIAKTLCEWAQKEGFGLKLKGGVAMGQLLSEAQFKALSKLPGRNELLVGFAWALKSQPTKFLYALQEIPKRMAYALVALKAKKEQSSKT